MAGYVFVSYSRRDKAYVESLAACLRDRNIDVWVDERLEAGDNWERVLRQKVDDCAAVVVVMTPDSENSVWVQREIQRAENQGKPIFPLLLRGEAFWRFEVTQYEDVTGGRLPSEPYIAKVRAVTGVREMQSLPSRIATPTPVGLDAPAAPKQLGSGADRTWIPYARSAGHQVTFQVVNGTVCGSSAGSDWVREWDAMGDGVTRLVASQTGSHLVAQSPEALVIGRVDDADGLKTLTSVPISRSDIHLVAARHKAPRSEFDSPLVEVLLATPTGSEIWVLYEGGLDSRRELAASLRAGVGTDDGFLVVTDSGSIGQLSPPAVEPTILGDLGGDWLDIDASSHSGGIELAALRQSGEALTATCGRALSELVADVRVAPPGTDTIRVLRRPGSLAEPNPSMDTHADVWLVSPDACVALVSLPSVTTPSAARPQAQPARSAAQARQSVSPPRKKWDVFLSYSTTFSERASRMRDLLEERGMTVWYAPRQHVGSWLPQILEGIDESSCYVVVWGPGSDRELFETVDPEKPPFMQLSEIAHCVDSARAYRREVHVYLLDGYPDVPAMVSSRYQLIHENDVSPGEFADQVCEALHHWRAARGIATGDGRGK